MSKIDCSVNFDVNLAERVKEYFSYNSYGEKDLPDIAYKISELCRVWDSREETIKSPIEEILYSHILFCTDGFHGVAPLSMPEEMYEFETWISPQYKVGRYTGDFVFCCRLKGKEARLLVECDGHDFHEKTKEQAAHDKKRNRYFTAQGYKILRFTGSEIHKNTKSCAKEITNILETMMDEFVIADIKNGKQS